MFIENHSFLVEVVQSWIIASTMGKKDKRESYNGTILLNNCKTILTEQCNDHGLTDYILDDYQFSDKNAEYYKGYHLNAITSKEDRGICYDADNLKNAITIAVMPFTLENINIISRELAIMRSTNSEHLLRYQKFSHVGSYFIVEFPLFLRLSDLIEIVKKDKKNYETDGCIPQKPMIKIIAGILKGLSELHQMKIYHSKLESKSIYLSVHNDAKILLANYTDIKPSKCKVDEDGPLENYMAPEQLVRSKRNTGKFAALDFGRAGVPKITEKVDIWAVGMIIYEMVIGKPLYKKDFEQSKNYRRFIDKIMYMPFPTIDEMYPLKYSQKLDSLLSCCVERNICKRPCAIELLENFIDLFKNFDSEENLILEAVEDSRSILASFLPNRMERLACYAADEPSDAKLSIPLELMDAPERLKWKRFNKPKIDYQRSCSLSFGDSHLLVKVRKKSMILSRLNPFIYVQSSIPPHSTRAISYIQEAVFQLVKKKVLNKFQALLICSIISQLTQFNLLDEQNIAKEFVVSETYSIDQHNCMQKVLIPLQPMSTNEIICDSKTLYQSVLLEYVFPKIKNV